MALLEKRWKSFVLMIVTLLAMSACGFHLRGASEFPFKTVYVAGS